MCSMNLEASTVKLIGLQFLASDVAPFYVRRTLLHFFNHLGPGPRCKTVGIHLNIGANSQA